MGAAQDLDGQRRLHVEAHRVDAGAGLWVSGIGRRFQYPHPVKGHVGAKSCRRAFTLLAALALPVGHGCAPTKPVKPLALSKLRAALPPDPDGFVSRPIRERNGLIARSLSKKGDENETVGTLVLRDALGETVDPRRIPFARSTRRFLDYPAIETSMGGGVAVRIADRFEVEAVSLSPKFPTDARDRWLSATKFTALTDARR